MARKIYIIASNASPFVWVDSLVRAVALNRAENFCSLLMFESGVDAWSIGEHIIYSIDTPSRRPVFLRKRAQNGFWVRIAQRFVFSAPFHF